MIVQPPSVFLLIFAGETIHAELEKKLIQRAIFYEDTQIKIVKVTMEKESAEALAAERKQNSIWFYRTFYRFKA